MLLKEIKPSDFVKLGQLFNTPLGEECLDILNTTFYNTVSFTPGDTHTTSFKEGQRDIVQVLRNSAKAIKDREKE